MFSTVRYFIKTSIIFLITGLLTGLYMSVSQNLFGKSYSMELVSAHTHIILFGTVMMMIMGVALWFFPRPEKEDTKYKPGLILVSSFSGRGKNHRATPIIIIITVPNKIMCVCADTNSME